MTEQETDDSESKTTRTRRPSSSSKTATRKRSQSNDSEGTTSSKSSRETQRRPKPKIPAGKAALAALEQLQQMTTRTPESVVGVKPHEDGYRVTVEVVESARIPNTADIMAEYEVDIDGNGDLVSYNRKSRYFRGRTQTSD